MKLFRNLSIKTKLVLIQSVTAFIAVLICSAIFVVNDVKIFKDSALRKMHSIVRLIGDNSISPLHFLDNETENKILSNLATEPDIMDAIVLDRSGKVFGRYTRPGVEVVPFPPPVTTQTLTSEFSGKNLIVTYKIVHEKEFLGTVILRTELKEFNKMLLNYILLAALFLFAGFFVALISSIFLQRTISNRLLLLVSKTQMISETGNYSIRVLTEGNDEIATLSSGINNMLDRIEKMESSLEDANAGLEQKIKDRTAELERVNIELESIFNAAPEAIILINQEGNIVEWNNEAETLFGWDNNEVIGKQMADIIIPSPYREQMKKGLKHFVKTGEGPHMNKTLEFTAINRNNEEFDIELMVTFFNQGGKYLFIGFVRDITRKKQLQNEIKQSQAFLNSVIDNIPDMVFVKDAKELRFVRLNPAGEKLLGFSAGDLIGKNDYDFFPQEQADFFTSKDREVLRTGRLVDIPEEQIDSKKGKLWLHTKKISIKDENGNPVYLLGISEDITEKKKLEDEKEYAVKLRIENELRMNLILENIAEGVIVADTNKKILLANRMAEEILNINENNVASDLFDKFKVYYPDGEVFPAQNLPLEKALKDEATNDLELVLYEPKSKETKNILISGRPVKDEQHRIIASVATIRDITKYKKMEKALERSERERKIVGFRIDNEHKKEE